MIIEIAIGIFAMADRSIDVDRYSTSPLVEPTGFLFAGSDDDGGAAAAGGDDDEGFASSIW